jgi:hypothetical protein
MPEHSAAGFIQNETPKLIIRCDETALFPNRIAWRRGHPSDNDITNFTFCVAANHMNNL